MARDKTLWKWTGSRFKYIGATKLDARTHTVYASPRMAVQFKMDREGIAGIAVGDALHDATRDVVEHRALPYAVSISPHGRTGEYVSSWKSSDGDDFVVIAGMRRAACKLINASGHAAAVEWVSKRGYGRGYAVLRRTLAHLNSTSLSGPKQAASKAARKPFDPQLHPRGAKGRFVTRQATPDEIRRRARRASQMRDGE